jgi:hypothetical protein
MRSYLAFVGATVSLVLGLTVCLGLVFEPFEPLVGDLTRTGNFAERDFGWQASQPVIQVAGNGTSMADPDILVLGDSFSSSNVWHRSNFWQSVVTGRLNQKIQSFEFARVGCVDNWLAYALNHPTAKTIVIESVERAFLSNFKDLPTCTSRIPAPFEAGPWTTAPNRRTWPPEWHIYRTFMVSINTVAMQLSPHAAIRDDKAVNAPIDRSCAKFSNRRSDRILYFSQDEEKFQWKQKDVARATSNILRMQKLASDHGKKFVLMLVPDKLSTYQKCLLNTGNFDTGKEPEITASLIHAGVHSPDMLGAFRENANKIEDLYRPNDTHVSEAGYILMGETLAQFLTGNCP